MKTAKEWQDELAGETSTQSICAIQADALSHAVTLLAIHTDSYKSGLNAIVFAMQMLEESSTK